MNEKLQKLNVLRDEVVNEVLQSINLDDSPETNLQKLRDIEEYLGVEDWIQCPYQDAFGEQLKKKVWQTDVLDRLEQPTDKLTSHYYDEGFEKYRVVYDEITHDMSYYGLGHVVDLLDHIEYHLLEYCEGNTEETIRVLTNRFTSDVIEVTIAEATKVIISWIIEHKKRGFVMDR